jgi:hypothetical protein
MPEESESFTHRLASARYYVESQQSAESASELRPDRQHDQDSWENALSRVSPLVGVMLLAGIGAVTWKHRESLADTASGARERSFNPIQLVLWMTGAEKKISDAVVESQRQAAAQFEEFKPAYFGENLKPFDTTSLWSPPGQFNGSSRGR